jgi:hypothetical protein
VSGLGYSPVDVGSTSDSDCTTFYDGADAGSLSLVDFWRHQLDHVGGFGLCVTGLVPGAQVNKDVFVGQDRA